MTVKAQRKGPSARMDSMGRETIVSGQEVPYILLRIEGLGAVHP